MKIISIEIIDRIIAESKFENINNEILQNSVLKENLERYLALTQSSERFKDIDSLDIFYNRYYWYLKFLTQYQKEIGVDVGLEQQEFKILEEGGEFPNIDWHEVERISTNLKNGI